MLALLAWTIVVSAADRQPSGALVASDGLRISQVYGGGGNSGALYTHDYVELFNAGQSVVDLSGWSVQYASGSGSTWQVTPLDDIVLQPGQYALVQEGAGAGGSLPLPTADVTGTIALGATAGKVALVVGNVPLSGTCPQAGITDLAGYGNSNCYEGAGPSPAPSNTVAIQRGGDGCLDSDDNSVDFTTAAPAPRNRLTPLHICSCFDAEPPTQVTITLSIVPAAVDLAWLGGEHNVSYQVWRRTAPFFTPVPGVDMPEADLRQTRFIQTDVVGTPAESYAYLITARNACDAYAGLDAGSYVGIFEFDLMPGAPSSGRDSRFLPGAESENGALHIDH